MPETHTLAPTGRPETPKTSRAVLWHRLVLACISLLVAANHLLRGPNFVLDDWFSVREAVFDGVLGATTADIANARPGVPIAYALTFGLFETHPLPMVLVLSAIMLAVALTLYDVSRQYTPAAVAFAISAVWVYLPNHTSLEVWPSTVMISLSLLCVLQAIRVLGESPITANRRILAVVLALAGSAFYEASIPLVALAFIAVPRIRFGRFDRLAIVMAGLSQGTLALWIVAHWHPSKNPRGFLELGRVPHALFGDAVLPGGLAIVGAVGFVAAAVAVGTVVDKPHREASRLIAAGAVVVIAGLLPFAKYFYPPRGAGDRVNYISSIGGAMIVVGVFWALAHHRRAALTVGVVLVAAVGVVRLQSADDWDRAGDDGVAVLGALRTSDVDPSQPIVIGPEPVRHGNVASFLDNSNARGAVNIVFEDRSTDGRVSHSIESFESFPPAQRIDLREILD